MVGGGSAEGGGFAVMGELAAGSECSSGIFFLIHFFPIIINPLFFPSLLMVIFI